MSKNQIKKSSLRVKRKEIQSKFAGQNLSNSAKCEAMQSKVGSEPTNITLKSRPKEHTEKTKSRRQKWWSERGYSVTAPRVPVARALRFSTWVTGHRPDSYSSPLLPANKFLQMESGQHHHPPRPASRQCYGQWDQPAGDDRRNNNNQPRVEWFRDSEFSYMLDKRQFRQFGNNLKKEENISQEKEKEKNARKKDQNERKAPEKSSAEKGREKSTQSQPRMKAMMAEKENEYKDQIMMNVEEDMKVKDNTVIQDINNINW